MTSPDALLRVVTYLAAHSFSKDASAMTTLREKIEGRAKSLDVAQIRTEVLNLDNLRQISDIIKPLENERRTHQY